MKNIIKNPTSISPLTIAKIIFATVISFIYIYYVFEKNKYVARGALNGEYNIAIAYIFISRYILSLSLFLSTIFAFSLIKIFTKEKFFLFISRYMLIMTIIWLFSTIYTYTIAQSIADSGIPNTYFSSFINTSIFYICWALSSKLIMFCVFFIGMLSLLFLVNTKHTFKTINIPNKYKNTSIFILLLIIISTAPILKIILKLPVTTNQYISIF